MEQGTEVELEEVTALSRNNGVWAVSCDSGAAFEAKAVIVAAGARPRMLGVEREEELVGSGICYCAVCDGAFYAGKPVAVCGGGNSALQDAMLLSESCSRVYLVHHVDAVVIAQFPDMADIGADLLFAEKLLPPAFADELDLVLRECLIAPK